MHETQTSSEQRREKMHVADMAEDLQAEKCVEVDAHRHIHATGRELDWLLKVDRDRGRLAARRQETVAAAERHG